ncbi:MAG: hypothetical protein ABDK93_07000 [Atribacterota bacterium]
MRWKPLGVLLILCLAFFSCTGCHNPVSQTLPPTPSATIQAPGHQDFIK